MLNRSRPTARLRPMLELRRRHLATGPSIALLSVALLGGPAAAKDTAVADGARLAGSELIVTVKGKVLRGDALKGAIFTSTLAAGETVRFRIDRYVPPPAGGDAHQYVVSVAGATDSWEPFCGGADVATVPLKGVWNDAGARQPSKEFTFGCVNGALGKCVVWGYRPWASKAAADLHQACTRLVRADYCGTGESFTRDGTEINVVDSLGIQEDDLDWEIEAEWTPRGARCVSRPRIPGSVLPACAQKLLKVKGCGARRADGKLKSGVKIWNEVAPVKAP